MKILVIDDHPLIQVALKHVLEELDTSLELFQACAIIHALSR